MVTPEECLEAAVRLEMHAHDLYRSLASRYFERADLHELFLKLAAEEEEHARRIRALARNPLGSAAWDDRTRSRVAGQMRAMEAEAVAMLVRSSGQKPDRPDDLIRSVIDFERRFGLVHAEELAPLFAPEAQATFLALAAQDERHRALLAEAC
jgi:rubrerythrin